eukprot:CAMPEP_0203823254 /NCGR_PEP_ID=MMETSP0115-20131106/48680_1 /ASSEMBLY_ACC=CAM_ASM_000227 /TAXON_ID=33651 /ORGANISM="Bicosoecid sp, Strain ms1" /LENGTH=41 /DNA_ID= /DNA_START= /DNA_END= /DNA_ORIENTATION=
MADGGDARGAVRAPRLAAQPVRDAVPVEDVAAAQHAHVAQP